LSSKEWWEETVYELKKLFALDPDFHPKMFARQLAVIKGQAWNVVQSLKHPDEGPLELTRRVKVLVWDEEIEVAEEFNVADILAPMSADAAGPSRSASKSSGPPSSFGSRPPGRRMRSVSGGAADLGNFPFPPPIHRASTDITGVARPVPFASKVSRVNPGATGVSVLEHMEKLDKVEAGLKRLGVEEDVLYEEDEEQEQVGEREEGEEEDDDLPEMSMSTPTLPPRPHGRNSGHSKRRSEDHGRSSSHFQWASQTSEERRGGRSLDWRRGSISDAGSLHAPRKRVVIAEVRQSNLDLFVVVTDARSCFLKRLETIEAKPFFSCW
jgi:phosphatidylinositol 4-kinase type 2